MAEKINCRDFIDLECRLHLVVLFFSTELGGLRGAMAFALVLQSVHDLPEGHGQTIFTETTAIVVLTIAASESLYDRSNFSKAKR
ncbi:hypothetical protein MKW98_016127, partial [Papaver atlanticum]